MTPPEPGKPIQASGQARAFARRYPRRAKEMELRPIFKALASSLQGLFIFNPARDRGRGIFPDRIDILIRNGEVFHQNARFF
ncbi:MAG: hypothetical protein DBX55_04100 [Verrucomicrobia bacterium]|nr:MAG: hypothetical protein DBX55_04100 [Verrucomicrobiota bacterium]